jgi:hypothetical protein
MVGCNGDMLIQLEVKDLTHASFDLLTIDPNTHMVIGNEWAWNPFEKHCYPKGA